MTDRRQRLVAAFTVAGALLILGPRAECSVPAQRNDGDSRAIATQARAVSESGDAVVTLINSERGDAAVPGEIVVKFRDVQDADEAIAKGRVSAARHARLERVMRRHGMRGGRRLFPHHRPHRRTRPGAHPRDYGLDRIVTVQVQGDTGQAIRDLRECPEVEYAHPNYLMTVQWEPNDPYFASSGAWTQSFPDLWGLHDIGAPTAWDVSRGAGVTVAVVDTGVDAAHPDLTDRVAINPGETGTDGNGNDKSTNGIDDDGNGYVDDWRGWDVINADADPFDDHGHGTHVSGTIAASADNAVGIVGVAPQATILPVKVLGAGGSGPTSVVAEGIVYAADMGAGVINLSLGASASTPPEAVQDAVGYAHEVMDVVVVAAAGNSNADVATFYPAALRGTIAVAAVDHDDNKASFSNYGDEIDVTAPGGGETEPAGAYQPERSILSLASSGVSDSMSGYGQLFVDPDHHYLRQAGTSMASPHVAGVAALVRAAHPDWTSEQVRGVIRFTAHDLDPAGWDNNSGYGRVDAAAAMGEPHALGPHLTGPLHSVPARIQTPITGAIDGDDLAEWTLDYGLGATPSGWIVIAQGTAAPATEVLGTLDPMSDGSNDGTHTVRLRAWDSQGRVWEDRMPLVIDSITITAPTARAIIRGGTQIQILGTVAPVNMSYYVVSITGARGGYQSNPAIELANGGTEVVVDGLLATWDTTGVAPDHYSLCVLGPFGSECVTFVVDPAFHTTWLATGVGSDALPSDVTMKLALLDNLTVTDVDSDGAADILLGYGNRIDAVNVDGAEVSGWPRTVDPENGGYFTQLGAATADVDGDGQVEILGSNTNGQLFAWHRNGEPVSGWPVQLNEHWAHRVDASDVTGDGKAEVLVYGGGSLRLLDGTGTSLPGWPAYLGLDQDSSPLAVGDVDGDGTPELVGVSRYAPYSVYVRHTNGSLLPGWPVELATDLEGTAGRPSPTLGDLDGDGAMEIVINTVDGVVHVLHGNGTPLPGWPSAPMPRDAWPSDAATRAEPPLLADIDGDGQLEVICGGDTRNTTPSGRPVANDLFAWKADGTLLPGWPVQYSDDTIPGNYISRTSFGFGQPIAVDVDADGQSEVVVSSDANYERPFAIHAYRADGTEVSGWPRPTLGIGSGPGSAAAVADLDGDGLLELAWLDDDDNILIYDLPTLASQPQQWPMFRHDEGRSGAIARPVVPVPTLTLGDGSVEEGDDGTTTLTFTVTRQ
jgi:subtilisin family serine protease